MDPFEPLKYERPLQQLKACIVAEGSKAVFSPLIEKFILKNAHRVTVEMQVSRKLVTSKILCHGILFFMTQI
jgi:Zn-dependent M16 (insulinase) family peptidase